MLESVLLDNDVVLKMCAFGAAGSLIAATANNGQPPAILGVAGFSLKSQVRRSRVVPNPEHAALQLDEVLAVAQRLEPSMVEIEFAAELEQSAQLLDLELDPGESQLVSLLLHRCGPLLVTGDKRALVALASVAPAQANGRMACLEQLVIAAMCSDPTTFRTKVCSCRQVDTALTMCFSCHSANADEDMILGGLHSYIGALRAQAGRLMITSNDLTAVAAQEDRVRL